MRDFRLLVRWTWPRDDGRGARGVAAEVRDTQRRHQRPDPQRFPWPRTRAVRRPHQHRGADLHGRATGGGSGEKSNGPMAEIDMWITMVKIIIRICQRLLLAIKVGYSVDVWSLTRHSPHSPLSRYPCSGVETFFSVYPHEIQVIPHPCSPDDKISESSAGEHSKTILAQQTWTHQNSANCILTRALAPPYPSRALSRNSHHHYDSKATFNP